MIAVSLSIIDLFSYYLYLLSTFICVQNPSISHCRSIQSELQQLLLNFNQRCCKMFGLPKVIMLAYSSKSYPQLYELYYCIEPSIYTCLMQKVVGEWCTIRDNPRPQTPLHLCTELLFLSVFNLANVPGFHSHVPLLNN